MNGYLHNLTLRTLNAGNRVEPRLPAFFEPGTFAGEVRPNEHDVQVEAVRKEISAETERIESDEPVSAPASSRRSSTTPTSSRLETEEELKSFSTRVDPVPREDSPPEMVDSVETLPFNADPAAVQILDVPKQQPSLMSHMTSISDLEEEDVIESVDSLEPGGVAPLSPRSSVIDNKAAPGRRTPGRRPEPANQFQSPPTTVETAGPSAAKQLGNRTESVRAASETEVLVEEQHRIEESKVVDEEPQTTPATLPAYSRVNPSPPSWRDPREQPWRRRQSFAPIDPEPIINVTIGRVEVRAEPTNSRKPTSSRRSESPVMPLEDYLQKQRRRGGQR